VIPAVLSGFKEEGDEAAVPFAQLGGVKRHGLHGGRRGAPYDDGLNVGEGAVDGPVARRLDDQGAVAVAGVDLHRGGEGKTTEEACCPRTQVSRRPARVGAE